MTASDVVAALDRVLSVEGQTVTIRRYTAPSGTPRPKIEAANLRARVLPLREKELVGGLEQGIERAILSPTGLSELLPLRRGDKLVIGERERNIEAPRAYFVGDSVVRLELMVSG